MGVLGLEATVLAEATVNLGTGPVRAVAIWAGDEKVRASRLQGIGLTKHSHIPAFGFPGTPESLWIIPSLASWSLSF